MASQYWFNGKYNVSWHMERELNKLNIDLNEFDNIPDLIARLYNMQLDHMNHGKLDNIGLDITGVIREIERINN